MLLDLVKRAWKPLILIALVSFTITWAFNIQNVLIQKQINDLTGITYYYFNLNTYMTNISNAWDTTALNFDDIIPDTEWKNITSNILQEQFWVDLTNNLAFIANWAYFPINLILWIARWLAWLWKILLSIIGWNTQYEIINGETIYYSQLARILSWITQNMVIPYIEIV